MRCEIALPELGRQVGFDGEVLYRAESQGAVPGLGLRFANITPEDEEALIAWLDRREKELIREVGLFAHLTCVTFKKELITD